MSGNMYQLWFKSKRTGVIDINGPYDQYGYVLGYSIKHEDKGFLHLIRGTGSGGSGLDLAESQAARSRGTRP